MKKILYTLASLAVLAGCAKEAASEKKASQITLNLTLIVDKDAPTKTAYDGDSHIRWLANDALAVIIDFNSGSQSHPKAYQYSKFTIGDDLDNPKFSGSMSYMDEAAADSMWVYGVYPYSAMTAKTDCKIHGKQVTLPAQQTFNYGSWDGAADIMAIEPAKLPGTPGGASGYYSWASTLNVKFAHLFGFGHITFGNIADWGDAAGERLTRVSITAVNSGAVTNPLTGTFTVNLETDITLPENAPEYSIDANNTITLTPSDTSLHSLSEANVWFVASPGTYNLDIELLTTDHKITLHRDALVITRAKITSPKINARSGDVVTSATVVLDSTWKHNATEAFTTSGNEKFFMKGGKNTVNWGTSGSPDMEMNLSYPGATNPSSYFGSPQSKNGIYSQDFNYSACKSLSGVTVKVTAGHKFSGMKNIRVYAGDYKTATPTSPTSKISVFINGIQIGESQQIIGSTDSREGTAFGFEVPDSLSEGQLSIELSNFSNNDSCPYISSLEINTAPIITPDDTSAILLSAAADSTFNCEIIGAEGTPVVEADVDWISAVSYNDGVVSYSVSANSGNESRSGKITVSASNKFGTTVRTYTVSQLGAQYKLYTLNLTYDDIRDSLEAAFQKSGSGTYFSFEITDTATATDASEFVVHISCTNIHYSNSVQNEAIAVYGGGSTLGYIKNTAPVYAISAIETKVADNQYAPSTKIGKESPSTNLTLSSIGDNTYWGTATIADENKYFQTGAAPYRTHYMKYVKITFVN